MTSVGFAIAALVGKLLGSERRLKRFRIGQWLELQKQLVEPDPYSFAELVIYLQVPSKQKCDGQQSEGCERHP